MRPVVFRSPLRRLSGLDISKSKPHMSIMRMKNHRLMRDKIFCRVFCQVRVTSTSKLKTNDKLGEGYNLERWSSGYKSTLLLQRTQVRFPTPASEELTFLVESHKEESKQSVALSIEKLDYGDNNDRI
ncbi:hypothetical protein STEG23_034089 [Scotinomys teguina]